MFDSMYLLSYVILEKMKKNFKEKKETEIEKIKHRN